MGNIYESKTLESYIEDCKKINNSNIEKLKKINSSLKMMINDKSFEGTLAESIKNYLRDIEMPTIRALITAERELESQQERMKESFKNSVDNGENVLIYTEELDEIQRYFKSKKNAVEDISKNISNIARKVNNEYGEYADYKIYEKPSSEALIKKLEEMCGTGNMLYNLQKATIGISDLDTAEGFDNGSGYIGKVAGAVYGFENEYKRALEKQTVYGTMVEVATKNMEILHAPVLASSKSENRLKQIVLGYQRGQAEKLGIIDAEIITKIYTIDVFKKKPEELTIGELGIIAEEIDKLGSKTVKEMTDEELVVYVRLLMMLEEKEAEEVGEPLNIVDENIQILLEKLKENGLGESDTYKRIIKIREEKEEIVKKLEKIEKRGVREQEYYDALDLAENIAYSVAGISAQVRNGNADGVKKLVKNTAYSMAEMTEAINKGDTDGLHQLLDLLGMIPEIGFVFDYISGMWYEEEGKQLQADLSYLSALIDLAALAKASSKGSMSLIESSMRNTDDLLLDGTIFGAKHVDEILTSGAKQILKESDDLLMEGIVYDAKMGNNVLDFTKIKVQLGEGVKKQLDKIDLLKSINNKPKFAMEGGNIDDIAELGLKNTDEVAEAGSKVLKSEVKDGVSKSTSKLQKSVQDIIGKAKQGKIKYAKNYHGRLGKELESTILSNPDAVYVSGNKSQNLIYRKGDNVVIVESVGSSKGNVITSYGPDGARGNSGAAIFGGSYSDPGMPVTHDAIVNGKIPTPSGETMPPATQIYP